MYYVTEACVKCKYTDCVDMCPTDCFYEGENMLVIDPEGCISCGVCEPMCPVNAIVDDTDPDASRWAQVNKKYAQMWQDSNINTPKDPPPDAEEFTDEKNKFEKFFSEKSWKQFREG